jgi:HEPN domain-containing protein
MTCYLSQQAIEKALKAIIIGFLRERPPHTHDLTVLYARVKSLLDLGEKSDLLPEISQYYITARYPNAGLRRPSTSFSRVQAERALEVASCVLERVKEAITKRHSS